MSRRAVMALTRERGPMTVKQIALDLGVGQATVCQVVQRARAYGTRYLCIADWVGNRPRYVAGPGEDCPERGDAVSRIREHLLDAGPATMTQLAEALLVQKSTVQRALAKLRAMPGKIHVSGWKLNRGVGGREAPIYSHGRGVDVPRPDFSTSHFDSGRRRNERDRIAATMARRKSATR